MEELWNSLTRERLKEIARGLIERGKVEIPMLILISLQRKMKFLLVLRITQLRLIQESWIARKLTLTALEVTIPKVTNLMNSKITEEKVIRFNRAAEVALKESMQVIKNLGRKKVLTDQQVGAQRMA